MSTRNRRNWKPGSAKGHTEVTLPRDGDEQPEDYAYRLKFLQTKKRWPLTRRSLAVI